MSDKLHDTFPLVFTFKPGEQPDSNKLSKWSAQTNRAIRLIEYALGDIWGLGRPYTNDTTRQGSLFSSWGYDANTVGGGAPTGQQPYRDAQIANLSRLIGPASALNPRVLPYQSTLANPENVPPGVSTFKLSFRPVTSSVDIGGFNGTFSDVVVFNGANEVANLEDLVDFGDWHVTPEGEVFVMGQTAAATTVAYSYLTELGDTYEDSSFNVIPDPNQTANAFISGTRLVGQTACQVEWEIATARLKVTLPKVTHGFINRAGTSTTLATDGSDPNYNEQLTLPDALSNLTAGDPIPDGFLYLYDNKDRAVVFSGSYYYINQTSFYISGLDTTVANQDSNTLGVLINAGGVGNANTWRYSTITVGTTLTQSVDQLRWRASTHIHNGSNSEKISHTDLLDRFPGFNSTLAALFAYDGVSIPIATDTGRAVPYNYYSRLFTESDIPGNEHPQYLHRHGYRGGGTDGNYANKDVTNANDANAMRGDLVLAPVGVNSTSGYNWESGDGFHALADSHSLWFGNAPTSAGGNTGGAARLFFDADRAVSTLATEVTAGPKFTTAITQWLDNGLVLQRGNLLFDSALSYSTSVGFKASELIFTSFAGNGYAYNAATDAYKIGTRIRSAKGGSIYLGLRNTGILPWGERIQMMCKY